MPNSFSISSACSFKSGALAKLASLVLLNNVECLGVRTFRQWGVPTRRTFDYDVSGHCDEPLLSPLLHHMERSVHASSELSHACQTL